MERSKAWNDAAGAAAQAIFAASWTPLAATVGLAASGTLAAARGIGQAGLILFAVSAATLGLCVALGGSAGVGRPFGRAALALLAQFVLIVAAALVYVSLYEREHSSRHVRPGVRGRGSPSRKSD